MLIIERREVMKPDSYKVGDRLEIHLTEYGKYFATCHKVDENKALFIFDEVLTHHVMNDIATNEGGFYKSDLCEWMNNILLIYFPDYILNNLWDKGKSLLRLPTVAEIYGPRAFGSRYGIEDAEQLPLMANRKFRVCASEQTDYAWYWLMNPYVKDFDREDEFAFVADTGRISHGKADNEYGIRPAFELINRKEK